MTGQARTPAQAEPPIAASADLFRHVTADKAAFYRAIMAVFAAAKRQYARYCAARAGRRPRC
jgi:hypothetical protein